MIEQFLSLPAGSYRLNLLRVKRLITLHNPFPQRILQIDRIPGIHDIDIPNHPVHIDRNCRNFLVLHGRTQNQQHFLRPSQGKYRNQYLFLLPDALLYQRHQALLLHLAVGMKPVAVGGLHNGNVRAQFRNAQTLNGPLGKCGKIPGIKQRPLFCGKIDTGSARYMSCRIKRHCKSIQNVNRRLISHRPNPVQHGNYIPFGIVRNFIFPVIHYLQTVIQKHSGQIRSHGSHIYLRIWISFTDNRKCSDMIHMRMAD